MKTRTLKYVAAAVCAVLCIGSAGVGESALAAKRAEKAADAAETAETKPAADTETKEPVKDETVYVIAEADGAVQKIIVSDWLKNTLAAGSVTDSTDLSDVQNVRDDAGYTVDGDGALVWDAEGKDIYYEGMSSDELPVDLRVSYQLDGKDISAEELAGKSGRVTIRFDYTNNKYETVEINGKQEKIYVPFAMLTGVMLDNDHFSNVTVSSGKILNDGNRTIVAGLALPGLQENLALDAEKLEIPDHVEITADAEDFSLSMTVTIAANGIFNDVDTEKLSGLDDLTGAADQLTDAMSQLIDGSSQLYGGLSTLLEKSDALVSGIHQLADGAKQLKDGSAKLADGAGTLQSGAAQLADGAGTLKTGTADLANGAGTLKNGTSDLANGAGALKDGTASLYDGAAQMQAGMAQLTEGLGTLTANNDALNGGAKQVFDTLLATAETQILASGLDCPVLTPENYADALNTLIADLDADAVYQTALAKVTAAVEANRPMITEKVTEAVRAQVAEKVSAAVTEQVKAAVTEQVEANRETIRAAVIAQAAGMTAEQYAQAVAAGMVPAEQQAAIDAAVENAVAQTVADQMAGDEVQAKIAALTAQNTDAQMQTAEVQAAISQNTEAQVQKAIADNMAGETVQTELRKASAGAQALISLKTQLDSYNAFYLGLQQYTAGVSDAAAGAQELCAGAGALTDGAAQVNGGAGALADGAAKLDSGAAALKDGIDKLDGGAGALKSGADKLGGGAGELQKGANDLNTGMQSLYDGILKMENGTPALVSGVEQLKDGAMQLSDGLNQFNEQGIKKLSDAVNGDLSGLVERFRATVNAAKHYKSFSGLSDGMDGEVKFIYKTAGIGTES
ncbi:MAG: hypothetical protein IKS42_07395 [Oscillospiraceae bacterium]|nr:hypothetical protein [Oscillospiraceae bacterium]